MITCPASPMVHIPCHEAFDEEYLWCELFSFHISANHDLYVPNRKGLFDATESGKKVIIRQCGKQGVLLLDYFKLKSLRTDFILYLGTGKGVYYRFEMDIENLKKMLAFKYCERMQLELNLISNLKHDDTRWVLLTNQYQSYWKQTHGDFMSLEFKRGSINEVHIRLKLIDLEKLKKIFSFVKFE